MKETQQAIVARKCFTCKHVKAISEFSPIRGTSEFLYSGVCIPCSEARNAKNKARRRRNAPLYRQALRAQVIKAYGSACLCCGETEPKFLAIDHIYNDGAAHRREGYSGNALYLWLRKNGFPKDRFQLLCHNCNAAKAYYGQCPHTIHS